MRGVAVCCGFNSYEFKPLDRAVNDAAILYAKLTESGTFTGAADLIGKGELFTQRTSANAILAAFTRAALSTADLVWFSFSGHAIVSGDGELRLLLPGWQPDASADDQRRYSIGAAEIGNVLRSRLASKKFIMVLDACYSGAFGNASVTRDVQIASGEQIASVGAVVISACARDQLAHDRDTASSRPNGAFTAAVIQVLEEHIRRCTSLSVLQLFQEAKAELRNGQRPTLYVNGLTDDFLILDPGVSNDPRDGIVTLSLEVPALLKDEISMVMNNVVQIRRQGRVGLVHAKRQLEGLAAEIYRYGDDTFMVPGHNSNVTEAFDNARTSIVGCTTPAYLDEWRRSGRGLLAANREFIASRGGRVVRFFFVPEGFESRFPGVVGVVRDHVEARVLVVIVNVDSFGPDVLLEVFREPRPRDLSSLECTFVDGEIFLKTHFVASGDVKIELDQRADRCQDEYRTQLRPFLTSPEGVLLRADLPDGGDGIVLDPLDVTDVAELRQQLDTDLGVTPEIGTFRAIAPDAARAPACAWRAVDGRRPIR